MNRVGHAQETIEIGQDLSVLATRLAAKQQGERRFLLGICGAPGVGKSTLAERLVSLLGRTAVVVPMDGFHIATVALPTPQHLKRRGAIDTFDVGGYLALLTRLRNDPDALVYAPGFDRRIEEPIAGMIPVHPDVTVVITEGNYLLSEEPQWREIRGLLDETWFLDLDPALRLSRLVARHTKFGKSPEAASAMALGSDEDNARVIARARDRADVIIQLA